MLNKKKHLYLEEITPPSSYPSLYSDGNSAQKITKTLIIEYSFTTGIFIPLLLEYKIK